MLTISRPIRKAVTEDLGRRDRHQISADRTDHAARRHRNNALHHGRSIDQPERRLPCLSGPTARLGHRLTVFVADLGIWCKRSRNFVD